MSKIHSGDMYDEAEIQAEIARRLDAWGNEHPPQ